MATPIPAKGNNGVYTPMDHQQYTAMALEGQATRRRAKTDRWILQQVEELRHYGQDTRRVSAALVLVGTLCFFGGFVVLAITGLMRWFEPVGKNYLGEEYASGINYFPPTVSEMASDPRNESGKSFLAFGLAGGVCLLLSWYPWRLRGVYVGGGTWFRQLINLLRHVGSPIFCILMIILSVTPKESATTAQRVTTTMHQASAGGMFACYLFAELFCLCRVQEARIDPRERRLRLCIAGAMVFCIFCFQAAYQAVNKADFLGICCEDDWRVPRAHELLTHTLEDAANSTAALQNVLVQDMQTLLKMEDRGQKVLYNTASRTVLHLKLVVFIFECLTGICMSLGLYVIWYFSPERKFKLKAVLPESRAYNPRIFDEGEDDCLGDDYSSSDSEMPLC